MRQRWVGSADAQFRFISYRGGVVLKPRQQMQLADAHVDALRRAGGPSRPASSNSRRPGSAADLTIVIRPSRPEDDRTLARLAALDSATVPAEPLLVAEADGALRAALSLHDGAVIADPFHRTAPLVALLTARAGQLRGERSGRRRWCSRLRFATPTAQRLMGLSAANRAG